MKTTLRNNDFTFTYILIFFIFTAPAAWVVWYISCRNSVCLSVCLSVRHTRALWQNQKIHCEYFDTTRKGKYSCLLTLAVVGGRCPLPSQICAQSDPPPFVKRRLRQILAYNVSTVIDSEKSSIMTNRKSATGFPMSYRWSAYVTSKSPKGWLKSDFLSFTKYKIQFQSNKVWYKVPLCENCQRHSCSIPISPSNGP